jgi:rubredoxin
MGKTKLHALRFRCGVCHYASNEKHPDFFVQAVGVGAGLLHATVICPKCKEERTIFLGTVWKEGRAE